MPDTVEQIIYDVQSVCPDADPNLARLWVRDGARRTFEARPWSFLIRRGVLVVKARQNDVSLATTVTVTKNSDEITFASGVATDAMIGMQFRVSDTDPVYDVIDLVSSTKLKISPEWKGATASGKKFTLFHSRLSLPDDCLEVLSCTSPANRWQLWLGVPQEVVDAEDPARTRGSSNPSLLSPFDYASFWAGGVEDPLRIVGAGAKPLSGGMYSGQSDAIFTVTITTGGVGGTAVFKWRKNEDAEVTGVVTDPNVAVSLQDGVSLLFPASSTFNVNDVFLVRTYAGKQAGVPRVEIYPYPSSETYLHILYVARYPDITDPNVPLPGHFAYRGDVIREKALEFAATWPGTEDRPNPYTQINRRDYHAANWLAGLAELDRVDKGLFQRAVFPAARIPFAPWPFAGGRNYQEYDPWSLYHDAGLY